MHAADLNLAGLATISLLALFFPGVGLLERRAEARAKKRSAERRQRELEQLMIEEAMQIVNQSARETAGR
jgi:hypothetical protein